LLKSVYVSPPDRPERMYQRDRRVWPDFDGLELLYLRYGLEDLVEGQLRPSAIHFPKTSVNRGSLSQPEDVLFAEDSKYNGLGVVEFKVSDIPPRIAQDQGPPYVFFMRHVPEMANYSHSEIWSDQDPQTGDYREPSKTVRLKFRIHLCQRIRQEQVRIVAERRRVI
jgi:hypothetical protein